MLQSIEQTTNAHLIFQALEFLHSIFRLVHSIGQGSCRWLIDDTENIETRNLTSILRRLKEFQIPCQKLSLYGSLKCWHCQSEHHVLTIVCTFTAYGGV